MRPYTGIQPESLPDPSKQDFHSRLRSMLEYLDYWARDASFGFNRITLGQNPDGSGDPIGGDADGGIFFRLLGRASGQVAHFSTGAGGTGVLASTIDGVKGKIFLGNALGSAYDEANNRLGVGTASPSATLQVSGATTNNLTLRPSGTRVVVGAEWEWRGQDGGSNIETYVDEVTADDNDYMKVLVDGTQAQNSAVLLLPTPSSTPSASNTHVLRIRYRRTGTGGTVGSPPAGLPGPGIDAAVYKNGILVAGGTYISVTTPEPSGSFTEATATLNATQITNLGNYQGLEIWVNWTGSSGSVVAGSEMQVSWVELDCGTATTTVPIAKFDDGGVGSLPSWTWDAGMVAVTPDLSTDQQNSTKRIELKTSDSVNIFNVQSDGATTITVPFTTYSASNPIALTLQMDDNVTPNNPMFRIRTNSSNVFTVSYYGGTLIDMTGNAIALAIQQFAGATNDFTQWQDSGGLVVLGVDSAGDIYGGNQATSTLNLYTDNNADSTTGSIRMTATPTVEIRSGASGNTYIPYTFGIGTAGGNTFTGNNVAWLLTATSGGATAGFPSITVNNSDATHASIATVLYRAIRKSGQTGNLFNFLDSNGTTVLSNVDKDGAWNGPIGLVTGLSTFDHILIDNASASDVLLKMTPIITQSANVMEVWNYQNTHKDFEIGPGGLVTAGSYDATDDDVRFQVRIPNTQTSLKSGFQVVRSYSVAGTVIPNTYVAMTVAGDSGAVTFGDTGSTGAGVKRLQLRQGTSQTANLFEAVNQAGTASFFTLNSSGQMTLADGTDPTKTLKFTMSGLQTGVDITQAYISTAGGGDRTITWSFTGASGTAGPTFAWGGTSTARTITFPSSASFTVAGLSIASQTWTGTHLFTGGSSGNSVEIYPTNDITSLVVRAADLSVLDDIFTVYDGSGNKFFRVGNNTPAVNAISFALWPSGIDSGSSYTLTTDALTASRTAAFPNASGNVVLTSVFDLASRTTDIGSPGPAVTIIAAGVTGTYLINWYAVVETAAGSGPSFVTLTVAYTDSGQVARTETSVLDTTTLNNRTTASFTINTDGSVAATYKIVFTTASGSPAYDSHLGVTRIG